MSTVAILFATLWPFNPFPRNNIQWLSQDGIHFGKRGILRSRGNFKSAPGSGKGCSLEILLRPDSVASTYAFLTFYSPEMPRRLQLGQYHDDLMVLHSIRDARGRVRVVEVDADHTLRQGQPAFLTITSGEDGTNIYLNGMLVQRSQGFRVRPDDFAGELILGVSPIENIPWPGELRGLAFYNAELSSPEVGGRFEQWRSSRRFAEADSSSLIGWYDFSEGHGDIAHNGIVSGPDLVIPESYSVPHKAFLKPFWKEFFPNWPYVNDVLRNIAGFMPLGFVFFLYFFLDNNSKRAILYSTIFGACLSLSVEILQAFVPVRDSGTTDIITNTTGTFLGAWFGSLGIGARLRTKLRL